MDYITHRRFRQTAICGELNLSYGTRLVCCDGVLTLEDGRAVCFATSENAKAYFARNDDGMGLERGKLSYAIAYGKRKNPPLGPDGKPIGFRFSEAERDMLYRDYAHWIRQDCDFLLFNQAFFDADVEALRELAERLKIKV